MSTTPSVVVFDVNETLSDMSPMAERFTEVGAPAALATLWFTTLLRDGFALTLTAQNTVFADLGAETLRNVLVDVPLNRNVDQAVKHIMTGMNSLTLHPDVPDGIRALHRAHYRLVTLSNGSTAVAAKLFKAAGIRHAFEALLSVEDAPAWKPAPEAYRYAAEATDTDVTHMLLVAVHPWDIHGAAHAGMQTAWLNRARNPYPSHFSPPDHTITALTELPHALAHRSA